MHFPHGKDDTLGLWFVNDKFQCYILEDEYRNKKVYGQTRIPEGTYEIKLRTVGGFHQRYLKKFGPEFHKGMLHLQRVPNFKYVLVHIGNDEDDTDACLLPGDEVSQNVNKNGYLGSSTKAYKRIYPPIANELLKGKRVFITIKSIGIYNT